MRAYTIGETKSPMNHTLHRMMINSIVLGYVQNGCQKQQFFHRSRDGINVLCAPVWDRKAERHFQGLGWHGVGEIKLNLKEQGSRHAGCRREAKVTCCGKTLPRLRTTLGETTTEKKKYTHHGRH